MTPERWQQIDHLLEAALNQPPELRTAFLDEACAGDEVSRDEIDSLLSFRERAESFLETPALAAAAEFLFEPRESLLGRMLGAYRIESELGSGGMGEVYLAHDTILDRKLAIKLLPFELDEGERTTRLIREAKAIARLDHPNICAIHEVAEEDGISFIVMQHVDGETLASLLERRPDLSKLLDVMAQVADALSEAHAHGIVHRDIKPQNIMITNRGQVKVLDFGLAKVVGSVERPSGDEEPQSFWSAPGVIAGTAPYMSPEQATGSPVDTRSDLFSLGVVLYQCVARRLPFSGSSPMDTCRKVAHYHPPAPSELNPNISPDLDRVIMKMLAKDPGERYQSASDLSRDLRGLAAALSIEMPGQRTLESAAGWSVKRLRRRTWAFAALVLLFISIALLITLPGPHLTPSHTPTPAAYVSYQEGMVALRAGSYHTASQKFKQAVRLDGNYALALARIAESLAELDDMNGATRAWVQVTDLVPERAALPPVQRLYLDAINQTLVGDFGSAVQSYKQIVEAEGPDKALEYFDLGRAYEKAGDVENALVSYEKAAGQPPWNPAALLRAGILYRYRDDAKAARLFDSAEQLYSKQNNDEGLGEVLRYRGLLNRDAGQLEDARIALEDSLTKAEAAGNHYQQVRAMLALSGVLERLKRADDARLLALRAEAIARQQDLNSLPTQAMIEIGDVYRSLGLYDQAEEYLSHALEYAERREGRTKARALVSLGRLYVEQHRLDKAWRPYIDEALGMFQQQGDPEGEWKARFQIANATEFVGEYDDAQRMYEECTVRIGGPNYVSRIAQVQEAIGFLFAHREAFPEALERFETARGLFESIPDDAAATNNLLNIADMLWRLGRYREARQKLSEASGRLTNHQLEAKAPRIEILMALSKERFWQAASKADQAVALNETTGHLAEVKAAWGLALSLSGQSQLGLLHCQEAVEERVGGWMLWSAQLALAETLLRSGDAQRALETALKVQRNFVEQGQRDSEWRAWLVAAQAASLLADDSRSREYATRAQTTLMELHREWGEGYLNRRDVRAAMRQIASLLVARR